jgi:hypothetical protein
MSRLKSKRYPENKTPTPKSIDGCAFCFLNLFAFGVIFIILEFPIMELVVWLYPTGLRDEYDAFSTFLTSLWWNFLITTSLLFIANKYKKWRFKKRLNNEDILDAD